jgi:hypothetical protein
MAAKVYRRAVGAGNICHPVVPACAGLIV